MYTLKKILHKTYNWDEPNTKLSETNEQEKTVHPFTLVFPHDLEEEFQKEYHSNSTQLMNVSIILGMVVYFIYSILDFTIIKHSIEIIYIKNVIGSIIFLITFVGINRARIKKKIQPFLCFTTAVMGILNIVFTVMASPELNYYYYIGNILIIMWAYILLRMQFVWALTSGIMVFFFYQIAAITMLDLNKDLYIISTSNLFAANLIGLFSAYILEFHSRKIFYNKVKLKESNERLRVLFDNVYDAIFIIDVDGNILDVNNKVIDLFNVSQEQVKNLNIRDISSRNNNFEKLNKIFQNVVSKGKIYRFEWRVKRLIDEIEFEVEVFLNRINIGLENSIIATVRDISEQKEAHKKLLLTQRTVESNTTPIYWFNSKYEIIYANNSAVEQTGYNIDELYNMKFEDFVRKEQQTKWIDWCERNIIGDSSTKFEIDIIRRNGSEFNAEVNVSNIIHEKEEIAIALVNDITERKKISENLILAKEKAEQSDKLKTEFLAGMSHEIRTPVNTIVNFVSLIKNEIGNEMNENMAFAFQMINNGSKRLIRTIDSILNMSQFQTGSYEVFVEKISLVDNILFPLINEFEQTAKGKNLKLIFENDSYKSDIKGDEYTLKQLFINLIDNAIKYTEEGFVKVKLYSNEKYYRVDIEDSGIGMSKEFIPSLFQPFSQEEQGYTRSFDGNGLGLALVKKYIDLNNGKISVESEKGKGTIFKVQLPIAN